MGSKKEASLWPWKSVLTGVEQSSSFRGPNLASHAKKGTKKFAR